MANHPTCNALLVCDTAIRDADTGKTSLIGIFETIYAPRFPAMIPWIVLYAKVSDVEGTFEFAGEFVRLGDERLIGTFTESVTFQDRFLAGDVLFRIPGLTFEKAGRYEFRLSTAGRLVGIKTFQVIESGQEST